MNSTTRCSNRVGEYVKHRPHYPHAVLDTLRANCGLVPGSVVADAGSGTGLLTEMFLRNGNVVYAVEPNQEMRQAAEGFLGRCPGFHSVAATAENTGLPEASVDFVTAAQAFHQKDGQATIEYAAQMYYGCLWMSSDGRARRGGPPSFAASQDL